MGDLNNYNIILSTVEYNDDPLKFGRIKCTIPGVIHAATSTIEAMPWIRPFKMAGYQSFAKPKIGQQVWVLSNKINYNEYWWFPYFDTADFAQNYLNDIYDNQGSIMHSCTGSGGQSMISYDDNNGYNISMGDSHINLKPDSSMEIGVNETKVKIEGQTVYCGSENDTWEPSVGGLKHTEWQQKLQTQFKVLYDLCNYYTTKHLQPAIEKIIETLTEDVKCKNSYVN